MVAAGSFFGKAVACVLAIASAVPVATAAKWPKAIQMPLHRIGGADGETFELLAEAGAMVKMLRIYRTQAKGNFLRGIYVEFTDGKTAQTGVMRDEYQEIRFKEGETINSMTLWGNGVGTRTGRIAFETSEKQKFEYGKSDVSSQDAFAMNVGSGMLLGFQGRSGADINAMSPIFLRPVKDFRVDNVKYPSLDSSKGLTLKTLKQSEGGWSGYVFESFRPIRESTSYDGQTR